MNQHNPLGMPPLPAEYYQQLLASAAVAIIATDREYCIVCWNTAADRLLGADTRKMLGKSLYQLVPKNRHKLLRKLLQRTTQRQETTELEFHLPSEAADQTTDLLCILSPITDTVGRVQGVAACLVDETRRTRLAERLTQAEKLASLGTLASGVAHHFNNILGGVATFVDYALSSGDTVAMKRALQMTTEAATRAAKITQSLLSFAKKDGHRTDLADLTEVVMTFSHLVERPLTERNIQLKLDLKPVPIIAVEANRMHQVLGNLLANAEDAMPSGGEVCLAIQQVHDQVVLRFSDSGCGIAPEHLPQIFEPFFTTKGLHSGGEQSNPGLGLSVAHGIVTDMGGRLDVESLVGQGTQFFLRFPIPAQQTT